jgi:hypothetical protein
MHDTSVLVKSTECEVGRARGKVEASVKPKLQFVMGRNDGYATLCKIRDILSGSGVTLEEHEPALNSSDLTLFKHDPMTSCDAERSFSRYKTILSDNRRSFLCENFKMHVVTHCNAEKNTKTEQRYVYCNIYL